MIQKINYFITRIHDGILYPFSFIGDFWGILFLSVITSVIVLFVYKKFSSPAKIRRAKDQIKANILAIRLYKDSFRVIGSSFLKSLFYTGKYFGLNFGVIIIMLPVLIPMFVQMDVRYGMRPFQPGEEIIVKATFAEDPYGMQIKLQESDLYKTKMNPVFINAFKDDKKKYPIKEVNWKLEAVGQGVGSIQIEVNGKVYEKTLCVGAFEKSGTALSNMKYGYSSWGHFFYPVEALFQDKGELESVYFAYPGRYVSFLGIHTYWWLYYLLLVLIIVLAFFKKLGIEF